VLKYLYLTKNKIILRYIRIEFSMVEFRLHPLKLSTIVKIIFRICVAHLKKSTFVWIVATNILVLPKLMNDYLMKKKVSWFHFGLQNRG